MKLELLNISGDTHLMSASENFVNHYESASSCAINIMEQINNRIGLYGILQQSINKKLSSVIDLGANVGMFSIFISPLAEKVFSVEPTPGHISLMRELIEMLGIKNIKPCEYAISTQDGISEFQVHTRNSTMNSFLNHKTDIFYGAPIKVETKTLSSLIDTFGLDKVDFVKMDIEGFENHIILDPSFDDASNKVGVFYIEVHDFENKGLLQDNYRKIENKFVSLGRKVTRIAADGMLVK